MKTRAAVEPSPSARFGSDAIARAGAASAPGALSAGGRRRYRKLRLDRESAGRLASALAEGAARERAGAACVIDVRVAPECARAVSSSLLRRIATD